MMRKKCFIGILVALCVCYIATSCHKNDFGELAREEFSKNFKAVVMGDNTIDPMQDWSTVASIPVEVSMDFGDYQLRTIYIYQTPPLLDEEAAYIGMVKLSSGETKTISVIKPAQAGLLYAACYDEVGHAVCKSFVAKSSGSKVFFGNHTASSRTATTGNNWSVPVLSMPNLTKYTTGNLVAPEAVNPDLPDDAELHIGIKSDYMGIIPSLMTRRNLSIYITGTWTLTFDQRLQNGNVIVVGKGGKIEIPKEFKLTTSPIVSSGTPGVIYILPGGEITGEGALELSSAASEHHHNSGTINVQDLSINGGILYNDGTIGRTNDPITSLSGENSENKDAGIFINQGYAYFSQAGGNALAIQNAAHIQVTDRIILSRNSQMDDGAYIECGALTLNGESESGSVLFMGNQSYLNCLGYITVNNYGVWGPSGSAYKSNAIFKINNCNYCHTTEESASTYMLDHVELVLPADYPTIFDDGVLQEWGGDIKYYGIGTLSNTSSGKYSVQLLYDWFNGYGGKMIDVSNYQWTIDDNNKYNFLWASSQEPRAASIDESRQTCTYSLGPSYTVFGSDYDTYQATFSKSYESDPITNYIYYAFEIADNNHDFNYNDVVFRIPTPTDNNDGTFSAIAEITAVGTNLSTTVQIKKGEDLDPEDFGKEVHLAIGTTSTANISSMNRNFRALDTLTFNSPDFKLDKQNFSLYIVNSNNAENQFSGAEHIIEGAPSYIVVSGNHAGKWFWPNNKMNIGLSYPRFNIWGSNATAATDWYLQPAEKKTVTY